MKTAPRQAAEIHALLLSVCILVAACAGPSTNPTAAPEILAQVRSACATTPYRNCERDTLEVIQSVPHRTLVVICDLGDGNGEAMTTLTEEDADKNCSSGGTVVPSKVVAIIPIP